MQNSIRKATLSNEITSTQQRFLADRSKLLVINNLALIKKWSYFLNEAFIKAENWYFDTLNANKQIYFNTFFYKIQY